jgi:hypothetical protein
MFTKKQSRGSLWMGVLAVLTMTSAAVAQVAGTSEKTDALPLQPSGAHVISGLGSGISVFNEDWVNLGNALAGVSGKPKFWGLGLVAPGHRCELILSDAAPNALAVIFVSLSSTETPFKGGTLLPAAPAMSMTIFTDSIGGIYLSLPSGANVPAGFDLYMQYAILDAAAVHGVALSNAIQTSTH